MTIIDAFNVLDSMSPGRFDDTENEAIELVCAWFRTWLDYQGVTE